MKNNQKRKQSSKKQDTIKVGREKDESQSNNNRSKKKKPHTSDQSQSSQTNVRNQKSILMSSKSKKKKSENADSANEEDRSNFLPGQKFKTPEEDSGALAFYKSLYEQNPKSQMAKCYCLQNGLLEYNEALRVLQELSKVKVKK